MRWEQLFADLEAQSGALEVRQRAGEVEERSRAELAQIAMVDRLQPSIGTMLTIRATGNLSVSGLVGRVGPDWMLIEEGGNREAVIALTAVLAISGLGRWSAAPDVNSLVQTRLGLRSALRAIARDRSAVRLHLIDASTVEGTLDRVGANYVEVAAHAVGELRRRSVVRDVQVVPFAALSALRRQL